MKAKLALTVLAALGIAWFGIRAGVFAHPAAHAAIDLGMPGSISSLPQANGVAYGAAVVSPAISARQAIDAAEAEYGLTDAQIDPVARATAVVVNVGASPAEQNMHVWVVTADTSVAVRGRPGAPAESLPQLCILIDAFTGKYIMAYGAGPIRSGY